MLLTSFQTRGVLETNYIHYTMKTGNPLALCLLSLALCIMKASPRFLVLLNGIGRLPGRAVSNKLNLFLLRRGGPYYMIPNSCAGILPVIISIISAWKTILELRLHFRRLEQAVLPFYNYAER